MQVETLRTDISNRLLGILSKQQLTLFAGAGVACHAGLPDWDGFMNHLADVASRYEELTAALMRARTKSKLHAEAAHYYKACSLIPEGEKLRNLASPFLRDRYDAMKLVQLVKLPFDAIVTTNYDQSLDQAWAYVKHNVPATFELDDGSLKQAAFSRDFFIARVHGRCSRPESMVVDTGDFAKLASNTSYTDFILQSVLSRRTCLFLGYSFLDPAMKRILELFEDRMGPNYPQRHFAIVPAKAEDLVTRLAQFNIEVLTYDDHDELWERIDSLPEGLVGLEKPPVPPTPLRLPFEHLRHYLAACYVRTSMMRTALPLRDLVIEGIVLSIVESKQPHLRLTSIPEELRQVIPLEMGESQAVVEKALGSLLDRGWVSIRNEDVTLAKKPEKAFNKNLGILIQGALNRLLVREGVEAKSGYEGAVREALEEIFLTRGWDLGAQFAGLTSTRTVDLFEFLRKSFRKLLPSESFEAVDRLAAATHDLLLKPDSKEAQVLADVARLCFGLSVLLQSGTSAIKSQAIPERIYLDSNIVMCAITEGHPLRPVYQATIQRLIEVSGRTGRTCELLVATEFLNEIVHHRKNAVQMVSALNLEDPTELERHLSYYHAENTNVFVGSYATWIGREKKKISFSDFLAATAPYTNESALQKHLSTLGLGVVQLSLSSSAFATTYREILSQLSYSYASLYERGLIDNKPLILIEHEARQLAQIELELKRGQHSVFVTADNQLRRILNEKKIGSVWNVVISHFAIVGLVELLVGMESDPGSLARLLWGIVEVDEVATLRDFFITRAAAKFDEALLMTLPQFADDLATEATKKAKLEGINFWSRNIKQRARTAKFLDRLEDEFYTNMAEVIRGLKEKERQQRPSNASPAPGGKRKKR